MIKDKVNDLRAFVDFAQEQLSNGGAKLTLDDALALWEYENAPEEEREETIRAIQQGLEDMYAGRTEDAFAFVERMRQKLRSAARP